jgi:hypothetical protein
VIILWVRRTVPKVARASRTKQEHSMAKEKRRTDWGVRKGSKGGEEEGGVVNKASRRENTTVPISCAIVERLARYSE